MVQDLWLKSNGWRLRGTVDELQFIEFENFHWMIIWKLSENFIMQPEQDILCCKSENGKC